MIDIDRNIILLYAQGSPYMGKLGKTYLDLMDYSIPIEEFVTEDKVGQNLLSGKGITSTANLIKDFFASGKDATLSIYCKGNPESHVQFIKINGVLRMMIGKK